MRFKHEGVTRGHDLCVTQCCTAHSSQTSPMLPSVVQIEPKLLLPAPKAAAVQFLLPLLPKFELVHITGEMHSVVLIRSTAGAQAALNQCLMPAENTHGSIPAHTTGALWVGWALRERCAAGGGFVLSKSAPAQHCGLCVIRNEV